MNTPLVSRRSLVAPLLLALALAGCPFGRPREVDCHSVRDALTRIDARLAPFEGAPSAAMTIERTRPWGEALGAGVADVQAQIGYVADRGVRDSLETYRDALGALRTHVTSLNAQTHESGPGETARRQSEVRSARARVDRMCPAPGAQPR